MSRKALVLGCDTTTGCGWGVLRIGLRSQSCVFAGEFGQCRIIPIGSTRIFGGRVASVRGWRGVEREGGDRGRGGQGWTRWRRGVGGRVEVGGDGRTGTPPARTSTTLNPVWERDSVFSLSDKSTPTKPFVNACADRCYTCPTNGLQCPPIN